jgi:hypothetical protein
MKNFTATKYRIQAVCLRFIRTIRNRRLTVTVKSPTCQSLPHPLAAFIPASDVTFGIGGMHCSVAHLKVSFFYWPRFLPTFTMSAACCGSHNYLSIPPPILWRRSSQPPHCRPAPPETQRTTHRRCHPPIHSQGPWMTRAVDMCGPTYRRGRHAASLDTFHRDFQQSSSPMTPPTLLWL